MAKRKLPYREGDWFAVPLKGGGYALGLIARSDGQGTILGYLFGPRRVQLPEREDTSDLAPDDAVLIRRIGDLGLLKGEWPIIHQPVEWNRDEWPLPDFGRIDQTAGKAWRVEYSDDTLKVAREVETKPDDVSQLPADGLYGYRALEAELSSLLSPELNPKSARAN
jgi:hypothetical protein